MSKLQRDDAEWRSQLTTEQYAVCRRKGTEPAFTGRYWDCKEPGIYTCTCCGQALFDAQHKFDSGTGWPSFTQPVAADCVAEEEDHTLGMRRN